MGEADRLLVLTGTTSSGKNRLGTRWAELVNAEIISLDSMKVYRGMNIGTAKPSAELRGRVPHHLLDLLDPLERMDLRQFVSRAENAIAEIHSRGHRVVVVGGTAMYLNGVLYGVHSGPSRDLEFRTRLRQERDEVGIAALHARLSEVDAKAAAKIDAHDYQRIERALEIVVLTGKGPSEQKNNWFCEPRYSFRVVVVTWPRDVLRTRIEARVEQMFEAGWIEEVKAIESKGGFSDEAARALGYPQIMAYLSGELSLEAAKERTKVKTWQFARRQLTWMKKYQDAEVILRSEGDDLEALAQRLAEE
ncbi:MAG: tRNA (adenosine(37)-N6)-dimethylallyltransferase MiaA [Planctomycetota bacterium]